MEEAAAQAAASYIRAQQPVPGHYSLIWMCSGEARPELRAMEILAEEGYTPKRVWLIDLNEPPLDVWNKIKEMVMPTGASASASRKERVKRVTFPEMTEELRHTRIDYPTTHCVSIHFQIMAESHPGYENGRKWRPWSEWQKEGVSNVESVKMEKNDIAAIKNLVQTDVGAFFKKWMGVRRAPETRKSIGFADRFGRVWNVTPDEVLADGKKLSDVGFYTRVNRLQIDARDKAPKSSVAVGGRSRKKDLKTNSKSTRKEKK